VKLTIVIRLWYQNDIEYLIGHQDSECMSWYIFYQQKRSSWSYTTTSIVVMTAYLGLSLA